MSDQIKITLPKLGESIVSATVVQWFKKEGDLVALDEPLLEVSTDKVNSEIPSPVAGILERILAPPDRELQVGEELALISTNAAVPALIAAAPTPTPISSTSDKKDFLSPSVMRLLREKGLALADIDQIPHTGQDGRLTKKDIEGFTPKATCPLSTRTERVKMTPMRKAIADNMVKSFYEAPHASLITEVDVTQLLKCIQEHKHSFFQQTGAKLTITSFVARAMARALKAFPLINSSLDGDTIVMKNFVNLGIAVSVDQGVMVPVIKNCQQKTLADMAKAIVDLAEKTRSHTLAPDDIKEGSITLTNFGMTGTMIGVPIIRYPEVAIIGLGAITRKVAAMPDDSIAIRSVMFVSLTFDHRVLDGIYGCGFLNELKKHLEQDLSLD
ncbi:MAG TPA: dihydrolipoamide acetyltransferase family protein [Chlamydiales bacterium]|nr:dihydrolipoamide acetyltransferase family protein [Chlamydiales bacterium]